MLFDVTFMYVLQIRYFTHHSVKYFWNDTLHNFVFLKYVLSFCLDYEYLDNVLARKEFILVLHKIEEVFVT